MKSILIWLRDPFYHVILGAGFATLCYLAFSTFDLVPACIRIAALYLYLRELTQVQCRYYGNRFYKGWTLRGDIHKWAEWVLPWIALETIWSLVA